MSRLGWCFRERSNKSQDPHNEYKCSLQNTNRRSKTPPQKKDCLLDHVQLVRQFHLKLFCLLRVADWVMSASFLLSHTLPRRIHLSSGISGRICSTVREHPKNTTILSGEWFYPESCRIWARRERSRPWYSRLGQLSGHIMSASYELSVALANPRYTA